MNMLLMTGTLTLQRSTVVPFIYLGIVRSPQNVTRAISLLYFKCWITRCEGINATTLYWNKDVGLKQGNNIIKQKY